MKINRLTNPADTFENVADIVRAAELLGGVIKNYSISGADLPPELEPVRNAFIETCWALKSVMRKYSRNVTEIIKGAGTEPEEDTPEQDTSRTRAAWKVDSCVSRKDL